MQWAEQTWREIAATDRETVVVLPIGSCEQHGDHLPLLTDTLLVSGVAARTQALLPEPGYLWLPTLWVGCSEHHRAMPGTVSLPAACYIEVLERIVEGFVADGFRRIVLLNGHGGNVTPGSQAIYNVCQRHDRSDLWVVLCTYWIAAARGIAALDCMETPRLTHACEYETSMLLALRPELVRMARARGGLRNFASEWYHPSSPGISRVTAARGFHQMCTNGAMGDPTLATAAKGEALLAAIAPEIAEFLTEFAGWPPLGD
ncbi:MAG: creatininase family protein [Fimbriimonadaceae bacterium]|nr:creatininase family protein [Fimbriimonadaceae bacterium]